MNTLNKFIDSEEKNEDRIPEPPEEKDDGFYTTIKVKFESQEDMEAFFDIVGQKFHKTEKEIEFPPRDTTSDSFSVTDFLGE